MKRQQRTRRVLKWAGLVVSILLVVAFPVSRWAAFGCTWGAEACCFSAGALLFFQASRATSAPHGWVHRQSVTPRVCWLPGTTHGRMGAGFALPLWIPLVLIALPTSVLWWRDRRGVLPGYCQKCGYNLTGNISGRCPECGEAI